MTPDRRGIIIATVSMFNWLFLTFYFYEWFYGSIDKVLTKASFYLFIVAFNIFILVQDLNQKSDIANQLLIICKLSNIINFAMIFISYLVISGSIRGYFFTFNGCAFIITLMIFISGLRHGLLKD